MSSKNLWLRLGALMRREREASGLSVRRIQSISGVHYRTMYAYERGEYEGGIMLNKYMAIERGMKHLSRRRLVTPAAERTKQHNGTGDSGNGRVCW